jgi:hypothetical protein
MPMLVEDSHVPPHEPRNTPDMPGLDDPHADAGLKQTEDEPGATQGVREMLRMADGAQTEAQARAASDATQAAAREAVQKDEPKKPSAFDENVVAVNLVPDPSSPSGKKLERVERWELDQRRQLAGAMAGIGGPLHHMLGRSALSGIDVQAGQGIVFGLTSGTDDPVTRLQAYAAASLYIALSRVAGALGSVADQGRAGTGRDLRDMARAMTTLDRGFRRSLEGVEAARARDRQRTSVPEFQVVRVGPVAKKGEPG